MTSFNTVSNEYEYTQLGRAFIDASSSLVNSIETLDSLTKIKGNSIYGESGPMKFHNAFNVAKSGGDEIRSHRIIGYKASEGGKEPLDTT